MDVGEKFLVMPSPGRNAFLHGVADKYALSSRLRRNGPPYESHISATAS
jgi:hypothetical protein